MQALCGLWDRDQVLRDGALVAHSIVDVGEAESVDLGDVKVGLQILQAAIERGHVDRVSLGDEVGEDFFRAGGVTCAFSVDAVEDVWHA